MNVIKPNILSFNTIPVCKSIICCSLAPVKNQFPNIIGCKPTFSYHLFSNFSGKGGSAYSIFSKNYKYIKLRNHQFSTMSDQDDKKAELRKKLTPIQYHVTQEKGTERAFTGKYNKCTDAGTYSCVVCDQPLFSSETKFDSGCGWPAFNNVLDQGKVKLTKDTSHGMVRTEVTCTECGAHLGHVFGDGPPPTRKRFCINSASLNFHPAEGSDQST